MICAARCQATFTRPRFQNSSLIVLNRARVALIHPTFSRIENHISKPGLSLLIYGTDAEAFMHRGFIEGGTHGIAVRDGGLLECYQTDIISAEVVGAEVRGQRSRLLLTECYISKAEFPANYRAAVGLLVHYLARAFVYRSRVEHCRSSGVCVEGGYCLLDYSILGRSALGLLAKGGDSRVDFDNSALEANLNCYTAADGADVRGHLLYETLM